MQLDAVIDGIYEAAVAPEGWPKVLALVTRAFDAQSGALVLADSRNLDSQFAFTTGIIDTPEARGPYEAYYGAIDPVVPMLAALPVCEVAVTSRTWDARFHNSDAFYNEYFLGLGLADSIGAALIQDEDRLALISVQRGGRAFSEAEARDFRALTPHLRRALQIHRQLAGERQTGAALNALFESLASPLILIDAAAQVTSVNPAANAILARRDGLMLGADRQLTARHGPAADALRRLIAATLFTDPRESGGVLSIPRTGGRAAYRAMVSPAPRGGLIVALEDPERRAGADVRALRERFVLTPSEGRLLGALLSGQNLAAACLALRISLNTGKFHLKGLFAKTGAHSQADLIRIALAD